MPREEESYQWPLARAEFTYIVTRKYIDSMNMHSNTILLKPLLESPVK